MITHRQQQDVVAVYDSTRTQRIFNGTTEIDVPSMIFVGTVEKAVSLRDFAAEQLQVAQASLNEAQAILDAVENAP